MYVSIYIYILGKKNTDTQAELYIYYCIIRVPLLLLLLPLLLLLLVGSDIIYVDLEVSRFYDVDHFDTG